MFCDELGWPGSSGVTVCFCSVSCPSPVSHVSYRIGGAIPTVFSYFAEVLAREKRGEHLSWLCMFWMIGGIYASAMAWAIIPHYGKRLAWWWTGSLHGHHPSPSGMVHQQHCCHVLLASELSVGSPSGICIRGGGLCLWLWGLQRSQEKNYTLVLCPALTMLWSPDLYSAPAPTGPPDSVSHSLALSWTCQCLQTDPAGWHRAAWPHVIAGSRVLFFVKAECYLCVYVC